MDMSTIKSILSPYVVIIYISLIKILYVYITNY